MNSSFKKLFAGVSAAAIALTQVGTALAAYSDVPAGVWYEEAVESFLDDGYLDASQTRFRGNDNANRAEFIKLVVELNGGILSTPPAVPSFDDVRPGAWYYSYMEEAAKEGWVKGDNNCYGSHPCNARPASNINRAEAAALIVRAFGLDASGDAPEFVDVPNGQWYTDAIQTAADHCVIRGDDTTGRARPADFMNRAEMVVMLHRVDQDLVYGVDCVAGGNEDDEPMITDVTATDASTVEVEFNVDISEDTTASQFMVSGASDIDVESIDWINASTVELSLAESTDSGEDYTLTAEDIETAGGETFSDSMDFGGFTDRVVGEGTLEVSLASSNPSGDTVPKGAVGVVLASVDLTADCADDVWIDEITVLHEGFGDESDIDGLYVAMDGGRISRKRTIDTQDQTASLRLSDALMVEACETVTVDIVADFTTDADTSSEHNIAIELPADIQSNALDTEGTFPLRGNTFRVASVTSGTLEVEYRTVSPDEVEVGDEGVVVGKFEFSTNAVEDQTIYSVTLENNGTSSDGDLQNIRVARSDGTVLTNTVSGTSGDFVTLTFDPPFTILEGDTITLEVLADITGGAADTIVMHFEEESDIFAVGSLYGFGINGQLYGSQVSIDTVNSTADTVTIQAGELTIEIDGPTQQKFTRDDDDAVLANFEITTGGDDVDIRDFYVAIEAQSSSGAGLGAGDNVSDILEDVELRNTRTGQSISAVRLTTQGTATAGDYFSNNTETWQIYRFDDFDVSGESSWELQVDFIDNGTTSHPLNGDKFRVHACTDIDDTTNTAVCTFGGLITATNSYNLVAEGASTGDELTDVRPGGAAITGGFHRIATPELNIAVRAIGTTDTAVKNSDNVDLIRFEARAGEAEDILLTQLIFNAQSGSLLNGQDYTLWYDSDGDGITDTVAQSGVSSQGTSCSTGATTCTVTFDDLTGGGVLLPAEESVLFEVHADIASSLTNNDLLLRFGTASSNYIEAEEADNGSSLSGIKLNGTCASTCEMIVTTTTSKNYLLVDQGDLFVTIDSTPVRSRQLLGGTLGDTILRLQFRAQNEDIDVTDLQFSSSGSNASSIDRLELYKDGATTAFATATVSGCGSDDVLTTNPGGSYATIQTFCANMENSQLIVEDGSNLDVIVKPRLKSDDQGALSGQDIQLWLTSQAVSDNSTGSGAVRARGRESSSNLTANDSDSANEGEVFIGSDSVAANSNIIGNVSDVVLSKIISITNANPDADNSNVPTGIAPFGQFKFTASTNSNTLNGLNRATLSGVIFNVNATNVDLDGETFQFYNKADSATKAECDILGSLSNSGSLVVECPRLTTNASWTGGTAGDTQLESGETSTFVLEVSVTNSKVSSSSNSTLQASFQDFTTRSTTAFASGSNHIDWTDQDSAAVSAATTSSRFKWIEYSETVVRSTSYKS